MVATRIEASAHQPDTCFSIMPINNRKKKMCRDQKVILLGDGGVGKTTLLHTIASSSTTSPDFRTKMATINHTIVKLQLWDTADQEKFGAKRLPNSYYRNAHGAFLVYDATNRNTFEAIGQWVSQLSAFYHDQPFGVVLVATNAENNRIVSTPEGQRLANVLDAGYIECDAGSEDDGLDCFNALVNAMSRKSVWTVDMESTAAVFKTEVEEPAVEFQCEDTMTDNQMEEECEDNQFEEEPMDEPIPSTSSSKTVVKALKSVLPIARQLRRRSVQIIDSNLPILNISSPKWKRAVYVSGCAAFAVAFMVGRSCSFSFRLR